ncbi:MAG: hypothetical protein AB7F19_05835 [Candidatus Babeliales bacterium]
MNRTLKTIIAATLLMTPALNIQAGGAKSAAIGIGSGIAGFMLGQAAASNNCSSYDCGYDNRYIERETVYIQEPPRTITVECPYLKRDLHVAQEQLARERSMRKSLEAENAQLRANLARSERTNDYLASLNEKLEAEVKMLKTTKVTTVVTTGHACNSQVCPIKKTGTPGVRNIEFTEKEQY